MDFLQSRGAAGDEREKRKNKACESRSVEKDAEF